MSDKESKTLTLYRTLSFSSYEEIIDFLGELAPCIMRTRPADDSPVSELPRNANAKSSVRAYRSVHITGGCE